MSVVSVGEKAPGFRLPSGQGPEVSLDDHLGKGPVVVWFTKGMACPFCRQHMSQIARGYRRFRELGAEVLEVTSSPPAKARFYVRQFDIPFPYLCDPDHSVRRSWRLGVRSHSPLWYAKAFLAGARAPLPPPSDFGDGSVAMRDMPTLLSDEDAGFFVLDRDGIVRFAKVGAYVGEHGLMPIPSNDEIAREIERAAAAPASSPAAPRGSASP